MLQYFINQGKSVTYILSQFFVKISFIPSKTFKTRRDKELQSLEKKDHTKKTKQTKKLNKKTKQKNTDNEWVEK